MWKIPVKYKTTCYSTEDGRTIQSMELEAINDSEAEARAFLNCVNSNGRNMNIRVETARV